MNYVVERNMKFNKYEYNMLNSNVYGKAMYTYGVLLRKFYIYNNDEQYILKEKT